MILTAISKLNIRTKLVANKKRRREGRGKLLKPPTRMRNSAEQSKQVSSPLPEKRRRESRRCKWSPNSQCPTIRAMTSLISAVALRSLVPIANPCRETMSTILILGRLFSQSRNPKENLISILLGELRSHNSNRNKTTAAAVATSWTFWVEWTWTLRLLNKMKMLSTSLMLQLMLVSWIKGVQMLTTRVKAPTISEEMGKDKIHLLNQVSRNNNLQKNRNLSQI